MHKLHNKMMILNTTYLVHPGVGVPKCLFPQKRTYTLFGYSGLWSEVDSTALYQMPLVFFPSIFIIILLEL